MASPDTTQIPDRPTKPSPARPAHRDSVLESLGKAITDPVREAADEADEEVKRARERAQPDPEPEDPTERPEAPPSPVHGR